VSDNLRLINTGKDRTKTEMEFGEKLEELIAEYETHVGYDSITCMLDMTSLSRKLAYMELGE